MGGHGARRRPRRGIPVKPGSVRAAREALGLSQRELAGSFISSAAIQQLESGKIQPSFETLDYIARRTWRTPESFIVPNGGNHLAKAGAVERLARLVAARNFHQIATLGTRWLEEGFRDASSEHRVRFYLGLAKIRLNRGGEAKPLLEEALSFYEGSSDEWLTLLCLEALACAHWLIQSDQAIRIGREALNRCRRMTPRPRAIEGLLLHRLAAFYVRDFDWKSAIGVSEELLEPHQDRSLIMLPIIYMNYALALDHAGRSAEAIERGHEALRLFADQEPQPDYWPIYQSAGTMCSLAESYMHAGLPEDARTWLEESVRLYDSIPGVTPAETLVRYAWAEWCWMEGDYDEARRWTEQGLALAKQHRYQLDIAEGHMWLGVGDHEI